MMSCLWILVFGSLIATGVRTQEGEAEGSEEANTSIVAADLPPAEEEDPALSEDGDAGSPEAATEEAATTITPEDTEEPAETEAEPEMTASEQDETTDSPSDETEKPITEAPEMESKTAEPGLFQEETYTLKDEGPEGGESDPSEGNSDLSDQMNETQTRPEEGETKSTVHQASVEEISAENSIGDAGSPREGAGTVRSAGAVAEPNGLGSGTVAGVVAAIGVAIIGAISSYLTYQKKMLCFKVQRRDPERPKEENGTQNDPQALSSLLNSP